MQLLITIVDHILASKWKQIDIEHRSQELHKLYNSEMKKCMSEISKFNTIGDQQISESIQCEEKLQKKLLPKLRKW